MPTIQELGQKVKSKYPGQYDDIPDAELGMKIRAKYPEYGDFGTDGAKKKGVSFEGVAREFINQAPANLPALGGIVGSLGGPVGAIGGAAAGSMVKQGIEQLRGREEISPSGVAQDTLIQGVLPQVVGPALGGLANFIRTSRGAGIKQAIANVLPTSIGKRLPGTKVAETINKVKGMLSSPAGIVETIGENARAYPEYIPAKTGVYKASKIPYTQTEVTATPKLATTAKEILSDIREVRNAKLIDPAATAQLVKDDVIRRNFNFSANTFHPDKILQEIGEKPDLYKEALGNGYNNFKNLMEEAQKLKVGQPLDRLLDFKERFKLYAIGGIATMAAGIPTKASVPLILGIDAVRKIAHDPELGQLVIQAMKTPKTSPAAPILGRAIANGLRGTSLYYTDPDSKKPQKVEVGPEGNLQLPAPQ